MQGQFTQDLKQSEKGPCYGLWLDQKGKVLADSHIQRVADNDYRVISFSTPMATLRARLEAYLIADEVELHDESGEWAGMLLWGGSVPTITWPAGVIQFPSRRADEGANEILVPKSAVGQVVTQLMKFATEGTIAAAALARLRTAIPAVPEDIGPRDLPAEGALDEVAISYTKGCYLGQEVMARLKNLGQVRRALHLISGRGVPPAPGTGLHQGERRIGETRTAAADGENFLAMVMLSLVNLDPAVPLARAPGGAGEIKILRRV